MDGPQQLMHERVIARIAKFNLGAQRIDELPRR